MSLALIANAYDDITTSDSDSDSECCSSPTDPDSATGITAADTDDDDRGHPSFPQITSKRKITGRKIASCSVCSKTFSGSYKLATHMLVHTGEKPYQCPICKKRFQQISNVRFHLRNVHKKDSSQYTVDSLQKAEKSSKVKCHKPALASRSRPSRKPPQRQASPVKNARKPNGFDFRCPYCDAIFAESNALIIHLQTHHDPPHLDEATSAKYPTQKTIKEFDAPNAEKATRKKIACPICKCSLYRHITSVRKHMEQHSQTGRPLQCSECNLFFKRQSDLLQHKNQRHGRKPGKTMVPCKICKRECPIGFQLNQHMRIHTGERPFECAVCAKSYREKSHLTRHMKLHSERSERSIKCPDCPSFFTTETNLNIHRSQRHGRVAGRTKFACNICKKTSIGAYNLIRHMKVHKGKTKFDCPVCSEIFQRRYHLVQHLKEKHGQDWSSLPKIANWFSVKDEPSYPDNSRLNEVYCMNYCTL